MAAPTFVDEKWAASSDPASSRSVPTPTHVADDVLIALVTLDRDATITPPAGWTQIWQYGTRTQAGFWKRATSTEPSDLTFTFSGSAYCVIGALSYRNAGDPPAAVSSQTGSGTACTWPSVTTPGNDCMLVGLHSTYPAAGFTSGIPAGWDFRINAGSSANGLVVCDRVQASAGPSGTTPWTLSTSVSFWRATVLAIPSPNSPPFAPTRLGPADGATLDRSIPQRFSWQPNDPDAGDTQSAYEIRYRKIG